MYEEENIHTCVCVCVRVCIQRQRQQHGRIHELIKWLLLGKGLRLNKGLFSLICNTLILYVNLYIF